MSSRAECDFQCHIHVDVGAAEDYCLPRDCDLLEILGRRWSTVFPVQELWIRSNGIASIMTKNLGFVKYLDIKPDAAILTKQILGQICNSEMFF